MILSTVLLLDSSALAATIHVTSGGTIEARAWREVGDDIEVTLKGGTIRFPKGDVVRIERPPSPGQTSSPSSSPAGPPIGIPSARTAPNAKSPPPPARPPAAPGERTSPRVENPPPPAWLLPSPNAKGRPNDGPTLPTRSTPITSPAPMLAAADSPPSTLTPTTEGRPVEEWRKDLASPTVEIRRRAVTALAHAADDSLGAFASVLTPALRDADPGIRLTAALAMATSGQEASTVTTVLVSALRARDPALRRTGSMGLIKMGPAAKDAASVLLLAFAADPDATVRQNAANALLHIGPAAKEVVPELTSALQHRDPEVRRAAATILADFGKAPPSASPATNTDARPQSQILVPSGLEH